MRETEYRESKRDRWMEINRKKLWKKEEQIEISILRKRLSKSEREKVYRIKGKREGGREKVRDREKERV